MLSGVNYSADDDELTAPTDRDVNLTQLSRVIRNRNVVIPGHTGLCALKQLMDAMDLQFKLV